MQDLLSKIEEKNGIGGYIETRRQLVEVSQTKAATDRLKGKTLEEISEIVRMLNMKLKVKESELKPRVKALRQVRKEHSDVARVFEEKKQHYDAAAAGLESDRLSLERDAHHMQEEAIRIESKYHHTQCLLSLAKARKYQIDRETEYLRGNDDDDDRCGETNRGPRLHRDIKSYSELYTNKLSQQASLKKVLHARQRELKESAGDLSEQKQKFTDLLKLLECKRSVLRSSGGASVGCSYAGGEEVKANTDGKYDVMLLR